MTGAVVFQGTLAGLIVRLAAWLDHYRQHASAAKTEVLTKWAVFIRIAHRIKTASG